MAINIYLGNVGSGKTLNAVRDMTLNPHRNYYTNIKNCKPRINKHIKRLSHEMIIKKNLIKTIKHKNGITEPVYELKVNTEFWQKNTEPCSIVLDEAHAIINSRRGMSKVNILVTEWLALIRRVLGEDSRGAGDLILITQLLNRIDCIARDMAHLIKYHVMHYQKTCRRCRKVWNEHSEIPEPHYSCPSCGSHNIERINFKLEVYHFRSVEAYENFKSFGVNSFHKHYVIHDVEYYFKFYDTLSWDNLLGDLY